MKKNELNPNFSVLSSNELKNVVGGMSDGAPRFLLAVIIRAVL